MSLLDDFTYLNRFIPKYPDDADYNTNSPSYYEYLAKLNKVMKILIQKIYNYDKELAKRFEEWDKNLQEFPDDVKDLLVKWLNDGTLALIINDEVLGNKADKTDLTRLENELKNMIENLTITTIVTSETEPVDEKVEYWFEKKKSSVIDPPTHNPNPNPDTNVYVGKDEPNLFNVWFRTDI